MYLIIGRSVVADLSGIHLHIAHTSDVGCLPQWHCLNGDTMDIHSVGGGIKTQQLL